VCSAWPYQASSKLKTWQADGGSLTREKEEAVHARRTLAVTAPATSSLVKTRGWCCSSCSCLSKEMAKGRRNKHNRSALPTEEKETGTTVDKWVHRNLFFSNFLNHGFRFLAQEK
jgi:hypothetical protein